MKLIIAFSPCPNDTYIFDALVHKKIDTMGIDFEVVLEDVETLNQRAMEGIYGFSKVSCGVLPSILHRYNILDSGSALGFGVGPLLVTSDDHIDIIESVVALPGEHTTAHLLFSYAYPDLHKKVFMRYDEIESFVQQKKGAGVIIHENRFTYAEKGLKKIIDLGAYWEEQEQMPIPLGCIVANRSLPSATQQIVDQLIRQSLEYANSNYPLLSPFVSKHAMEMNETVMRQHIQLYVNDYSLSLGEKGRSAIVHLLNASTKKEMVTIGKEDWFAAQG
jgi:1,4-dihydroxy-6-naphthoate synthase